VRKEPIEERAAIIRMKGKGEEEGEARHAKPACAVRNANSRSFVKDRGSDLIIADIPNGTIRRTDR